MVKIIFLHYSYMLFDSDKIRILCYQWLSGLTFHDDFQLFIKSINSPN